MAANNINPGSQVPTTPAASAAGAGVVPAVSIARAPVITSIALRNLPTHEAVFKEGERLWKTYDDLIKEAETIITDGNPIPVEKLPEEIKKLSESIESIRKARESVKSFFVYTSKDKGEMLSSHPETDTFFRFSRVSRGLMNAGIYYRNYLELARRCFSSEGARKKPKTIQPNPELKRILIRAFHRGEICELGTTTISEGSNGCISPANIGTLGLVVKTPIRELTDREKKAFFGEASILFSLPKSPYLSQLALCQGFSLYFSRGIGDLFQIREKNPLHAADLIAFVSHIIQGLQALHKAGIVHSDLKPENVIVYPVGNEHERGFYAQIADFGCSQVNNMEWKGGSHLYLAPELVKAHLSHSEGKTIKVQYANDIWALGILLLGLVINNNPFTLEDIKKPSFQKQDAVNEHIYEWAILVQDNASEEWLNETLWGIICDCLIVDPEKRPSAIELLDRFFPITSEEPISQPPAAAAASSAAASVPQNEAAAAASPTWETPPGGAFDATIPSHTLTNLSAAATPIQSPSPRHPTPLIPTSPPLSLADTRVFTPELDLGLNLGEPLPNVNA